MRKLLATLRSLTFLASPTFWVQTAERAIKTFAQAALAMLGGDGLGLLDVDYIHIGSVAGLAALLAVLTSIASGPVNNDDSPSLVRLQ